MSRVIKNDDGVVVVEGTPASTLVKDSDKFFATKAPERMAGESISQPRKVDPLVEESSIKIRGKRKVNERKRTHGRPVRNPNRDETKDKDLDKTLLAEGIEESLIKRRGGMNVNERPQRHGRPVRNPNRNEAKDKAETRRKKFFERKRSRKEAERSQEEQKATKGRFITTLGS